MRTLKKRVSGRPRHDDHRAKMRKVEIGGFKKPIKTIKTSKKKHAGYEENSPQSESEDSGDFSEEEMDGDSEVEEVEEVIHREPTMYDNLLSKLGSHNASVADALRRRQREEQGKSDTEEDSDSNPLSEEEEKDDDEEGHDNKSPRSRTVGNGPKSGLEQREEDALSDTDEESDSRLNDQLISNTFENHLSYNLASTEVVDLEKRNWVYKWKTPALNMSNCQWRGTGECFIKDPDVNSYYGIKPRLYKHCLESYKASGGTEFHQYKQMSFFSICNSYYDIMHHNKKPFYLRGSEEDLSIMDAYLMHSLNHIFRSRDLILKNEREKKQKELAGKNLDSDSYPDRGYTRPKVLILLPLAGIARRVVKRLLHLTPSKHKSNVENLDRFYEEFGSGKSESKEDDDGSEIPKSTTSTKPPDFQALLGRDNDNDHFMVGLKFTSRDIKLYGDFYTSDAIIASPLGLITKIGEAEVEKEKDFDYLSSIEILIIDHADVMLMQNWSHVKTVVEHLNREPTKLHGTDIHRIRPWYYDKQACYYRQTIILSSHINPEINALFNQHCLNYRGKVKLECKYKGVLPKILVPVRQIYERFDVESIAEADDARLKYFCEKVFPKIKDSVQNGVMIFISSYFEFVRIRNYLKSQSASFCLFGEYIKRNDISRVRGEFFRGEKKIILYTERAHFYYRYKIRGVQNLIIYSLPERKEFYPEIVNLLEESDNMNCRVLFSRLDHLRLERIVGSTAAKRMVESEKGVFVFA